MFSGLLEYSKKTQEWLEDTDMFKIAGGASLLKSLQSPPGEPLTLREQRYTKPEDRTLLGRCVSKPEQSSLLFADPSLAVWSNRHVYIQVGGSCQQAG